ncbi:helix-turn-helix transcriptional regulator [Bradyrhizobium sp. LM6.9]
MATAWGSAARYFRRALPSSSAQSMHRYVIERRMAEAAFLLETSGEPIARIASQVGYETAAAFSKLFHRHHGLSPGRYRANRHLDGSPPQPDGSAVTVSD